MRVGRRGPCPASLASGHRNHVPKPERRALIGLVPRPQVMKPGRAGAVPVRMRHPALPQRGEVAPPSSMGLLLVDRAAVWHQQWWEQSATFGPLARRHQLRAIRQRPAFPGAAVWRRRNHPPQAEGADLVPRAVQAHVTGLLGVSRDAPLGRFDRTWIHGGVRLGAEAHLSKHSRFGRRGGLRIWRWVQG